MIRSIFSASVERYGSLNTANGFSVFFLKGEVWYLVPDVASPSLALISVYRAVKLGIFQLLQLMGHSSAFHSLLRDPLDRARW